MFSGMAHQVVLPIILADTYSLGPNEIGLLQWGDSLMLLLGNQLYTRYVSRWGLWLMAVLGALFSAIQLAMPAANSLVALSVVRYLYRIGPPLVRLLFLWNAQVVCTAHALKPSARGRVG